MGEARRRKLAGNTTPDKQWHESKTADKHVKKVLREMKAATEPIHGSTLVTEKGGLSLGVRNEKRPESG